MILKIKIMKIIIITKKWPYLPGHLYKMLITGGSGSGKTNALLYLIRGQVFIC